MPEGAFGVWGWRIAFLLSGVLVLIGIWMRTRLEESPLYRELAATRDARARAPIAATLASHWRRVLTVLLVKAGENALFYVFTTFVVVFVTRVLHRSRAQALGATLVASLIEVFAIFGAGALADRIGRRPVMTIGFVAAAAWTFFLFPLAADGELALTMAAAIAGVAHALIVGGMSPFFVELFPTAARYTGFSVGYQLASVFSGAIAPIIGVALLERYGSTIPVSIYATAMVVPALACVWLARETKAVDLRTLA
jgi:MFS family permease